MRYPTNNIIFIIPYSKLQVIWSNISYRIGKTYTPPLVVVGGKNMKLMLHFRNQVMLGAHDSRNAFSRVVLLYDMGAYDDWCNWLLDKYKLHHGYSKTAQHFKKMQGLMQWALTKISKLFIFNPIYVEKCEFFSINALKEEAIFILTRAYLLSILRLILSIQAFSY